MHRPILPVPAVRVRRFLREDQRHEPVRETRKKYNDNAELDTSGVHDVRGSRLGGRGGLAIGGGGLGVAGLLVVLLINVLGGSRDLG